MKTKIIFGVVGLCGLVFLLTITGALDALRNTGTDNGGDTPGPDKLSTGRMMYYIYDPNVENKVIFVCEAARGSEEPMGANEPAAELDATARFSLEDIVLSPGTLNQSDTAVTIRSDRASLYRHAREEDGGTSYFFHAYLFGGVNLAARSRTPLVLATEEMEYWQEQKRISGDRAVRIRDADGKLFCLTGVGMDGMLDMRNLTVREKPVAYMTGGAFGDTGGAVPASSQDVTRITCLGPVSMRRFERPDSIGAFLTEFEGLKALGFTEEALVDFLSELQANMRSEGVRFGDRPGVMAIAEDVAAKQKVSNSERLLGGEGAGALLRALQYLSQVSPSIDAADLATLRDIYGKIAGKDIDLSGENGLVALTLVTFEKNVRAATRPAPADIETIANRDEETNSADFSYPFVDSTQECERMIVYCREEASARKTGGSGIEPVKVEMLRGPDKPVIIKSFGPKDAERKELDTVQTANLAEAYTARRTYTTPSNEERSRFVQTRLMLTGAVRVQKLERREGQDAGTPATAIYDASGDKLVWDRETGAGRLVGAAGNRPILTYSTAAPMSPSSTADTGDTSSSVEASAAEAIDFYKPVGETTTRVKLSKDVIVERFEVSPGKKRHDSLRAADWAEMVFRQDAMKSDAPGGGIFSNLDSMRALGRVDLVTNDGEAWGDFLAHEKRAVADRPAAVTTLYRITDANCKQLTGEDKFAASDWPLRAVMTGVGGTEFLGTTARDKSASVLETYTTVCDESIQYMDFTDTAMPASGAVFRKNARITKTQTGSATQTTLEAADHVDLDFVKARASGAAEAKKSLDLLRLYAEGQVHMTEPENKGAQSKLQEAKADRLTWTRLTAEEGGGKAADRALLEGAGATAPEVRYTVAEKVDVKKPDGTVETEMQEEQTIVTCSPDTGRITLHALRDAAQREKLEDNYVLAESGAHVHRTGATTDASGKRREDAPWDLRAEKVTTYYIPATEKGMGNRLKKIVAEGNVVAGNDQITATGAHGEWERIYQADIIERTTLTAAPGGTAQVRLMGKDKRGRPSDTIITCIEKIIFTRTIYDAVVSPQIAARADAVCTDTVSVERLGFADKDEKLNDDLYLNCDELRIKFADMLRSDSGGPAGGKLDVSQMIAIGNARYERHGLLKLEHRYPDERVMLGKGNGGYIEYNKTDTGGALVGVMRGTKNAQDRYVKEAQRWEYQHDKDTRKLIEDQTYYEHGFELPPALNPE